MAKFQAQVGHRKSIWLLVATASILLIDGVAAAALRASRIETKARRHVKPIKNPAVKTIKTEDGDIIDCVDIYKQPAFYHPALKNHTIQMKPTNHIEEESRRAPRNASKAQPRWMNRGSCPEGTIPILRTRNDYDYQLADNSPTAAPVIENAMLSASGAFHGASAFLNVWGMINVEPQDESSAAVSVGKSSKLGSNNVVAGWQVSPKLYKDQKIRMTIYWTADGSRATGCYNLQCPGFVQTDRSMYLGTTFDPISTYGGDQYQVFLSIYKDKSSNNWWLQYFETPVGYWPASIFKDFSVPDTVSWGGQVSLTYPCGIKADYPHSKTQMGNGHFSGEGYKKAAFIAGAKYRGDDDKDHRADGLFWADNKFCYDFNQEDSRSDGLTFFYGGTGDAEGCLR